MNNFFLQFIPGADEPIVQNPDGTYGAPPEGMFFNEKAQQWQSRENIKNNLQQHKDAGTEHARGRGDAFISGGAHGFTFGAADELYGLRPGVGDREVARAVIEHDRENYPGTALTGEIAGAIANPAGASGKALQGATTLARMGNAARTGGRIGAMFGFNTGEGGAKNRVHSMAIGAGLGAGTGAAFSAAGDAVRKAWQGSKQAAAIRSAAKNAPTTAQKKAEGQRLYKDVEKAGVQIKPESFDKMRAAMRDKLIDEGLDVLPKPGSLTPKSARVMQIADNMSDKMSVEPTAALPFKSLDQLQRHARTAAMDVRPEARTDAHLGREAISHIDDYVKSLSPDDVIAGDVRALQTVLPKAREVWAQMSKSRMLEDAMGVGDDAYMSGGASGIRNRFASILRSPKLSKGFTEMERKAMANVVNGSIPETILNYLGSGLGMTGQIGMGMGLGAVGGFPGAAIGAGIGSAAAGLSRAASTALTNRKAEIARALVANGKAGKLPMVDMNRRKAIEALLAKGAVANQN